MAGKMIHADDGFYFGMGLFETIALHHGRPVLEELHIRRLAEGLRALHIQNRSYLEEMDRYGEYADSLSGSSDFDWTKKDESVSCQSVWEEGSLEAWLQRNIDHFLDNTLVVKHNADGEDISSGINREEKSEDARNDREHKKRNPPLLGGWENGVLKVTVTEKNICFDTRTNPYTEQQFREGLRLRFSPVLRNETSPFIYYKTLNCADNILVHRQTQKTGYDEAVFVNTRGEICEGSVSNVFFTRGNLVVTPPATCGLLKGTVREFLLRTEQDFNHQKEAVMNRKDRPRQLNTCMHSAPREEETRTSSNLEQQRDKETNIEFREQVVRPEDLSSFTGMFITNALMGIMPVRSLGAHRFPDRHVAEALRRRYIREALLP
ncbi:MAG: aminotransferase class IV [Bilifractor sp.]